MTRLLAVALLAALAVFAGVGFVLSRPLSASPAGFFARQAAAHPPELWLAEALDDHGRVRGQVQVCTDQAMRAGLLRPRPEVNGQPCLPVGRGVEKASLQAGRCVALNRRYSVNVSLTGDPARDVTVSFALRPLEVDDPGVRQVTRYRRLGACPPGWRVGDSEKPGRARRFGALAE